MEYTSLDVGVLPASLVDAWPTFCKRQERNPGGPTHKAGGFGQEGAPSEVFSWLVGYGLDWEQQPLFSIAWGERVNIGAWLALACVSDPEKSSCGQIALREPGRQLHHPVVSALPS